MFRTSLAFFSNGLLGLPWWQIVLATLLLTHVTIISVTVYLHRCEAHRALELHPLVSHIHSPQAHGIWKVLLGGAELYRAETKNEETLRKFAYGTPNDWIERNL